MHSFHALSAGICSFSPKSFYTAPILQACFMTCRAVCSRCGTALPQAVEAVASGQELIMQRSGLPLPPSIQQRHAQACSSSPSIRMVVGCG
eukprot:204694-Rhodomonas_salina.1